MKIIKVKCHPDIKTGEVMDRVIVTYRESYGFLKNKTRTIERQAIQRTNGWYWLDEPETSVTRLNSIWYSIKNKLSRNEDFVIEEPKILEGDK